MHSMSKYLDFFIVYFIKNKIYIIFRIETDVHM